VCGDEPGHELKWGTTSLGAPFSHPPRCGDEPLRCHRHYHQDGLADARPDPLFSNILENLMRYRIAALALAFASLFLVGQKGIDQTAPNRIGNFTVTECRCSCHNNGRNLGQTVLRKGSADCSAVDDQVCHISDGGTGWLRSGKTHDCIAVDGTSGAVPTDDGFERDAPYDLEPE
jgi:hypothetical protein